MMRALSISGIDGVNLVPGTVIMRSTDYFREQGLEFSSDIDDFDEFELAPFFLKGAGALALMRYQAAPAGETTLVIPADMEGDVARFRQLIVSVAEATRLPVSAFHWRFDGEPASLSSPIDLYVGSRIRLRRTRLGMSQERLAEVLGLTFQQIQRYERGVKGVDASHLFNLAPILEVPVNFFFGDLPRPAMTGRRQPAGFSNRPSIFFGDEKLSPDMPAYSVQSIRGATGRQVAGFSEAQPGFGDDDKHGQQETSELVRSYYQIADPGERQQVLELIKSLRPIAGN